MTSGPSIPTRSLALCLLLAACGAPLSNVETLSDVTLAEAPSVAALPDGDEDFVRRGGLLSRLRGQPEDARAPAEIAPAAPEVAEVEAETSPPPEQTAQSRSGRLLGWIGRNVRRPVENTEPNAVDLASLPRVETATDAPAPVALPQPQEAERGGGLFGPRTPDVVTDASRDVAPGLALAFGDVGRNCAARSMSLGQRVETSETRGMTYSLYDSEPGATHPRTFYVTGFQDKCPRQFTAALAMFGSPVMHEQLRYGRPARQYPYSATDAAYERIKSDICGVAPQKPCGPRMDSLKRSTVFISTYERFTDNARWADVLLHDGKVLATALKTP